MQNGYAHIDHGFDPVFTADSRILVLGSFPSVLSRENRFFYGNPRNRFWNVIAACTHRPVPANTPIDASITEKRRLLEQAHIALWDVIDSCDIKGSSDASIKNACAVDIERITEACSIEAVLCNGRTAARLYTRYLQPRTHMPCIALPSTSPANAAYSLNALTDSWRRALKPYL